MTVLGGATGVKNAAAGTQEEKKRGLPRENSYRGKGVDDYLSEVGGGSGVFDYDVDDVDGESDGAGDIQEESDDGDNNGALEVLEEGDDSDSIVVDRCCVRLVEGKSCCGLGQICYGRCISRWPRTFALICGVILPLWLLIGFSIFFGYFLAGFEAPNEIRENDDIMQARTQVRRGTNATVQLVQKIPTLCFELYLGSRPPADIEFELENFAETTEIDPLLAAILSDELVVVNKTALYEFLQSCGAVASPLVEALLLRGVGLINSVQPNLTFNWIRCGYWADGLDSNAKFQRHDIADLRPEAQQEFYEQVWTEDQQQLYDQYLEENLEANLTLPDARNRAFRGSIKNATGDTKCEVNAPASAWFWFTIMTTIGYGNQAPETTAGRAMVYSLGFLSLLAFGAILTSAGSIVVAIFDDAVSRIKLHALTLPWVGVFLWGFIYYSWMILTAAYTKNWKEDRLDIEMSFSDGYWFSYISSTTIGLGDIFLEPEVILTEDLVTFPLLFLVSFVFLSSFFSKLAEMYGSFHAIDILLARIKMLDAPGDGEHAPEGGDDAPEGSKDTSEGGHDASEGGHDASEGGHDASEGGHDASEGSYEHG